MPASGVSDVSFSDGDSSAVQPRVGRRIEGRKLLARMLAGDDYGSTAVQLRRQGQRRTGGGHGVHVHPNTLGK